MNNVTEPFMFTESRKIQLIEEVIKTSNESTLREIESVLKEAKTKKAKKNSAHTFLGLWTKKDARLIEKAIEEGCEQINADDWK